MGDDPYGMFPKHPPCPIMERRPLHEEKVMVTRTTEVEKLLTPAEVASLFRVDPKTVTRWAKAGKLNSIRTLGGHRRYRESEVRALLERANMAAEHQPGVA